MTNNIITLTSQGKYNGQKSYSVVIGNDSFVISANNLGEAKKTAQFNKRMNKMKGVTIVRLSK